MGISINKISLVFFTFGFFLSQFYFWDSGLPQLSHILIILGIIAYFTKNYLFDKSSILIIFLFLVWVILVNLFWYSLYIDKSYIFSTVYWVFNILMFAVLINLNKKNVENFFKLLLIVIPLALFVEIFIWFLGIGRYNFAPRYNGLFNDPNQMAFWILSSCSIFLFISKKIKFKLMVYFLSLFLILLTMSRSAVLGFVFVTFGLVFQSKGSIIKRILSIIMSIIIVLFVATFMYIKGLFDDILNRMLLGLEQGDDQIEERGINILFENYEYLLFGAGQGNYHLFSKTGNEIHSTWIGILFYYGVLGFIFFIFFIYRIFIKLNYSSKIIFLGPMIYGFSTYNGRTSIFWFLLAIAFIVGKYEESKKA